MTKESALPACPPSEKLNVTGHLVHYRINLSNLVRKG